MGIKVSIIMPSLNVVSYIRQCLDSVIHQTLRDIEILCIDAGSTDGTREILAEYAARDARIRLIDSPVKSYGYQVNLGIRQAKGAYLGIVETDDRIQPDLLPLLYETAEAYHLDAVRCNFYFCEHIGGRGIRRPSCTLEHAGYADLYGQVIRPSDYPKLLDQDWPIWSGIYRREFLLDHAVFCQESPGAAYQDLGFSVELYAASGRTMYLDRYYYLYTFDRNESSIRQNKSMVQVAGEYDRLYNGQVIPETQFSKIKKVVDWKMLNSLVGMTNLVLPMVDYDISAALFHEPYQWFRRQLAVRFGGDYSDNICEVSADTINRAEKLIADVSGYARQLMEENQRAKAKRQNMAELVSQNNGKIVLFGCGIRGEGLLDALVRIEQDGQRNIRIDAAADNDRKRWGSSFCGIEVMSPDLAVETYHEDTFVIANKGHYAEMQQQLRDRGVREDQVVIFEP